ncbi:MAG TPA: efflux RND transporter periplasmic adaptor subunit [Bryobacteraceae bacterium]|nr:efflux RND transporter periplasmic adaptor subunit [Bryobacteraceae bacterium]
MRYTEPDPEIRSGETTEERLRRENLELRRQLEELKGAGHSGPPRNLWHPSSTTIWAIFLAATVVIAIAFFAGYIPLQKRRAVVLGEAKEEQQALPRVEVIRVGRSTRQSGLQLPGNIQPITEAPVLARADGYVEKRLVDIGDHVKAGQTLAVIDAPELTDQVGQAKATVQQVQAALQQATANVQQGKTDMELARVMAHRSTQLVAKGAVAKQDDDQAQAQYNSKLAALESLEKAIDVQRANVIAAQSNLARLEKMESYCVVQAPFDGIITLRNVDVGALVNSGSTLLYRIAQMGTLRTYVNVPQSYADSIKPGEPAVLTVSNLPGREFAGQVARSANALDPSSRTLLVEIHVPNPADVLLPGMYAQVELKSVRADPPLVVPSDAMIVRADGAQVAVVGPDHTVHLQKIAVGRDYGDRVEVVGGLREGDTIVSNPGDEVREGLKVEVVPAAATGR